jgi:hypothetical protein
MEVEKQNLPERFLFQQRLDCDALGLRRREYVSLERKEQQKSSERHIYCVYMRSKQWLIKNQTIPSNYHERLSYRLADKTY